MHNLTISSTNADNARCLLIYVYRLLIMSMYKIQLPWPCCLKICCILNLRPTRRELFFVPENVDCFKNNSSAFANRCCCPSMVYAHVCTSENKDLYRQSQYPKLWFEKCLIPIAPRLEQLACNREVMSSIPTRGELLSVNENSDCFKNGDAVEKSDTTRTCLAFRVLASAIKISMCVQTAISGQSSRFYDIIICRDELRSAAAEAKLRQSIFTVPSYFLVVNNRRNWLPNEAGNRKFTTIYYSQFHLDVYCRLLLLDTVKRVACAIVFCFTIALKVNLGLGQLKRGHFYILGVIIAGIHIFYLYK